MINYQGKLLQLSRVAVPDRTYSMEFAVYDVPTGGTPLWSGINASAQVKGGQECAHCGEHTCGDGSDRNNR